FSIAARSRSKLVLLRPACSALRAAPSAARSCFSLSVPTAAMTIGCVKFTFGPPRAPGAPSPSRPTFTGLSYGAGACLRPALRDVPSPPGFGFSVYAPLSPPTTSGEAGPAPPGEGGGAAGCEGDAAFPPPPGFFAPGAL